MSDVNRDIRISVRTTRDEGPRKSVERVDELGDHASKTSARLKLMGKSADGTSRSLLKLAGAASAAGAALKTMSGHGKTFDRVMFDVHKQIVQMGGALVKSLMGGLKLATVSMGAMSIAMVGVHAAFVAGKFLMKAYNVGLQALAATAAGAATGIGLVAAAIREQQAATYAYLGRGHKEFGNGLNQTRMMMRGLQMDTQLAGVGIEGLNKAFAEIAKGKGGYTGASKGLLKGLMDFAAAGQPIEEGIQKAAKLVAVLQDSKQGFGAIQKTAKELGPAMEEAMKKAAKEGINTKEKFIEAMNSGKLSMLGGVTGQFDAVNNTLIGQLKKYFNLVRGQFADFGQQFLPEAKVGLEQIYRIFTRTMSMTSGAVAGWNSRGGFVDVVVGAVEKISNFYAKLITEYLPKSEGMFSRLGDWWTRFKRGWKEVADGLRPLVDGARVIEKSFGNAWRPVWKEIKEGTKEFNEATQKNRPQFEKFGTALGEMIVKLIQVVRVFERIIQQNLPLITKIIDGVGEVFETLRDMFTSLEKLPLFSSREAFMAMMAMGRGMKTNKGTLVERTQQMNVQANNVSIMGGLKGAYEGYKVGRLGGPKSAFGGAAAGFLAGSGILGPKAKEWWAKTAGTASSVVSIKGILGKFGLAKGAAAAVAGDAAVTATSGNASKRTEGLAASSGRATKGLESFTRALGSASRGLRSMGGGTGGGGTGGGGTGGGGTDSGGTGGGGTGGGGKGKFTGFLGKLFPGHKNPKGTSTGLPGSRIPLYRRLASMNGLMGASHAYKAQREAEGRKGFGGFGGGMGSFIFSAGLARLAESGMVSRDVAGGLGLAASMAMFNPKLGAGIAGGTFALKSTNGAMAALGGAGAGAAIGSQFGPIGTGIGAAIGTITGAIMAPISRMRAATEQARTIVNNFFARSVGEMMVNLAILENAAFRSRKTSTTIPTSIRKQSAKYAKMADIAGAGAKGGGSKGSGTGLMDHLLAGVSAGAGAGLAFGAGIGVSTSVPTFGISIPALMGIGAAGGAAIGGTIGTGIYGVKQLYNLATFANNRQRRGQRGDAIDELFQQGAISKTEYEDLTKKRRRRFRRDEVDNKKQQEFLEDFAKRSAALATASGNIANVVEARTKVIAEMTGKSEIEVTRLAQTMGVNLADKTQAFTEQLDLLGVTMVQTTEQFRQSIGQLISENLKVFDAAIKMEQAPEILDEVMKQFRMDYNARTNKDITAEDAKLVYGTAFEQLTNMYGGDSIKAFFELQRALGSQTALAFQERNALGQRNPLGGLGAKFFSGMSGQAINTFLSESRQDVASQMTGQLGAILGKSGKKLAPADLLRIQKEFSNMSLTDQQRFMSGISEGNLFGQSATQYFETAGIGGLVLQDLSDFENLFMNSDVQTKQLMLLDAEREIIDGMGVYFGKDAQKPEWWSKENLIEVFKAAGIGDTTTPRGKGIGDTTSSRLAQTMSRHYAMDSMVSGSRTVTSAYRTGRLGSINSDHITGRAFDLVGQQLGMYKTTVERNGGFAEYHGRGGNRHLHVVPGPGIDAPMGDMTVPASKSMSPSVRPNTQQGGAPITINLNVNGLGIKEAIPQIKTELERTMYELNNRS